jgi:hypothetical protein
MVGEGSNRIISGIISRYRLDGGSRRLPDFRILWKGIALIRFAHFPTINSFVSNAAEQILQSRHVVGFPQENRPPLMSRDVLSEHPHSNEGCDPLQGAAPCTPTDRGPAVAEFRDGYRTQLKRRGVSGALFHPQRHDLN